MGSTLNPYFYAYNPQMLAYENAWVEYTRNNAKPLDSIIAPEVWESWERCREYGMNPLGHKELKRLDPGEIERRRMDVEETMDLAIKYIKSVFEYYISTRIKIDCLDPEGFLLYQLSNYTEDGHMLSDTDEVGTYWGEEEAGTNSISLVINRGRNACIVGAEHYLMQLHKFACSAAPVHDDDGSLLAIIRVCAPVEEFEKHTLGMVTSIAKAIESEIHIKRVNSKLQQSNHQLTALLSVVTDGVVYYADGIIQRVNSEMCRLLGKREEELIGKSVSTIKTTPDIMKIDRYDGDISNNLNLVLQGADRAYQCLYSLEKIQQEGVDGRLLILTRTEEIRDMAKRITNSAESTFADIVYTSSAMRDQIEMAKKAASFGSRILIEGESGTGKDLIAQSIHNFGSRRDNAFVAINCGAIPKELFESEMFGYEKGAFTGAKNEGKIGLLELADKGTVFLDEIGNMPLSMQSKLLRVLQEGSLSKIGGTEKINIDICVIAATNVDLAESVKKNEFREDLYYRLNVVNIKVPSLRNRREDIPVLMEYFLKKGREMFRGRSLTIDPEVVNTLMMYDWPGNVRQMQNLIERFYIINNNGRITMENLPETLLTSQQNMSRSGNTYSKVTTMEEIQNEYISYVVGVCGGNISQASHMLGLSRATIYKYLNIPRDKNA